MTETPAINMPPIDMALFVRRLRAKLAALPAGEHRFTVATGSLPLHLKVRHVPGATRLLVTLHGAAERRATSRPVFNGFVDDMADAHQVAVSDPTLQVPGAFRLAWFAGHQGFDTPALLRRGLAEIVRAWRIERTIFFGTSGGGFAALVQSHAMPGSIAVVGNPQTVIARYHAPLVDPYRAACWPALADNAALDGMTIADCTRLYAAGFRNTVIYVQSLGDRHHWRAHMLPFAAAIAGRSNAGHVLFHTDFHGVHGHGLPREAWAPWLRAAAISPGCAPAELLDTWHMLRARAAPAAPGRPSSALASPRKHPAPQDQATSDRLAAWLAGHAPRRQEEAA